MKRFKKLRVASCYGVWYYRKVNYSDVDFPLYQLFDYNFNHIYDFGFYDDMIYYVRTGIILC